MAALTTRAQEEERVFVALVDGLTRGAGGLNETLDDLDERVRDVAFSASRIGDQLQLADGQRAAAAEARVLAAHLSAFNDCVDGNLERPGKVARVFHDTARSAEAARLAQRLLRLAHDAADRERAGRAAAADAQRRARSDMFGGVASMAAPATLAVAIANLERYCENLENRLLGAFSDAECQGDAQGMKEAARTLGQFNKGASLAQRFIATRPMFMSVESLQEIEALKDAAPNFGDQLSHEAHATSAAKVALDALEGFYTKVREAVAAEVATAREIFPRPAAVLAPLVQRIIEQRVGAALDAVLPPAPLLMTDAPAGVDTGTADGTSPLRNRSSPLNKSARRDSFSGLGDTEPLPRMRRHSRFSSLGGYGDTTGTSRATAKSGTSASFDAAESLSGSSPASETGNGQTSGHRHFALLAHLQVLTGAVQATRNLGDALTAAGGGVVDAVAAADGLFTGHRARYTEVESDCLRGLAETAAAPSATPEFAGGKVPGLDRLVRWHGEAAERCVVVLGPPPPPPRSPSLPSPFTLSVNP
jgi:hypothetical protein